MGSEIMYSKSAVNNKCEVISNDKSSRDTHYVNNEILIQ